MYISDENSGSSDLDRHEAYERRGGAFFDRKNYDSAIADYTNAIEIDHTDLQALINRGDSYLARGAATGESADLGSAMSDFAAALAADPSNAIPYEVALETRADIYEKFGQIDKARADYIAVLARDPGNTEVQAELKRIGSAAQSATVEAPVGPIPSPAIESPQPAAVTTTAPSVPDLVPTAPPASGTVSTPRPITAAASPPAQSDQSIEIAFWNSIVQSRDRADFQAYLTQFPNGSFVALAKNRLAAMGWPDTASTSTTNQPTPPVAVKPAADGNAADPDGYWSENDSLVALYIDGAQWVFKYVVPSTKMRLRGAKEGDVLVNLSQNGGAVSGMGNLRSKCGTPSQVAFSGTANATYTSVDISGDFPVLSDDCKQVVGQTQGRIVLEFVSENRPDWSERP